MSHPDTDTDTELFGAQGDHGVDAGGAARRDVAGKERGGDDGECRQPEGDGVGGAHAVERAASRRASASAAARPTATPTSAMATPCPTTIATTARGRAPSATWTPISARPARHRVGGDAVDAGHREEERDGGEGAEEHQAEPSRIGDNL